jgi:hypothetical protein
MRAARCKQQQDCGAEDTWTTVPATGKLEEIESVERLSGNAFVAVVRWAMGGYRRPTGTMRPPGRDRMSLVLVPRGDGLAIAWRKRSHRRTSRSPQSHQALSQLLCRFSDAGMRDLARTRTAGVRKAPRHEIAGCWASTVQRALWGFGADVSVGEADPSLSTRWFWVEALACVLARMSGSQVGRDLRRYHGPILRTGASGGAAGREPARMGCVGAVSDRQ